MRALVAGEGVPFVPKAIGKDLIFSALLMVGILACSAVFGPSGPSGPPDPTQINTAPRPDFYFLSLFALMALLPGVLRDVSPAGGPSPRHWVPLCPAIPVWHRREEPAPAPRRRVERHADLARHGLLAYLGTYSPWSPQMDAWSGAPTPVEYVKGRTPLELQGALVLQNKQCRKLS